MMDGSMQEVIRAGAAAEHEQSCTEDGDPGRPDFAEELLPADEEMLEKDLSELDTLGLVSAKVNPNPAKGTCSLEAHSTLLLLLFSQPCMKGRALE
jgi:hypothetical protein